MIFQCFYWHFLNLRYDTGHLEYEELRTLLVASYYVNFLKEAEPKSMSLSQQQSPESQPHCVSAEDTPAAVADAFRRANMPILGPVADAMLCLVYAK